MKIGLIDVDGHRFPNLCRNAQSLQRFCVCDNLIFRDRPTACCGGIAGKLQGGIIHIPQVRPPAFQARIFQPVGNCLCISDAFDQGTARHIVVNLVADIGQSRLTIAACLADVLVVNRVQQAGTQGENRGKQDRRQNDCDNRNDVPAFAGLVVAAGQSFHDCAVVVSE